MNQYAAMPSLHVGWDLLAGIAIFCAATHWALRAAACLMPALMAWAVVATGNHYLLDVAAGTALVIVGHVVAVAIDRRRTAARGHPMTTLAIAHRAGNSLAGLHAANRWGWTSSSATSTTHRGRLEVRHLKTTGPLPFLWDRWELASTRAPRLGLEELLEADLHGTTFMLDLKGRSPALGTAVAQLLHEVAGRRPVLVCGRRWPVVERVAELPFVQAGALRTNRLELARQRTRLADDCRCTASRGTARCSLRRWCMSCAGASPS